MKGKTSHILLLGSTMLCSTTALHAQSNHAATSPATPDTDIVVTAQRREERLQDVPVAVNAATSQDLQNSNIVSAIDVSKIMSSTLFQTNNGTVTTFIRGIGNNQTPVGNEASNALYVDGVYYARITPATMLLTNIDRVEVLKGPQGTLFGRNATSGLIQIVTKTPKPGSAMTGDFHFGYGNYDTAEAGAYIASGLSENAAIDFSGTYRNQDKGFGTNIFTGKDRLKAQEYALRSKLVLDLTERTRLTLTGDYARSSSDIGVNDIFQIDGATPENPQGSTGLPDGSGLAPTYGFYDASKDTPEYIISKDYGGYGKIEHEFDFATLVNTLAYREDLQKYQVDIDTTSQYAFVLRTSSYSKQLSNELQLGFVDKGHP